MANDFADDFADGFGSDNDSSLVFSKLGFKTVPTPPLQNILLVLAFRPAHCTLKLANKSRLIVQQCKTYKIIKPRPEFKSLNIAAMFKNC